jgi:multicomponent Na+:H+ antiporter subunit G
MTQVLLILSALLTLAGAIVVLVATIGLLRFPDAICRAHAVGKGLTLGLALLLTGLWLDLYQDVAGWKVLAIIVLLFATLPVASHLIARLAVRKGLARYPLAKTSRR